ncbi:hypothetical protein CES85_2283 [Ochrobactrum quorumnocens]|uniref:Uncharacterized protein n=1 Tax=Ochrobactrum quorumnocens TaxID=271865 RepID=A0A248UGH4_9HYPH|nr:hypothetical protein CES85_2283 [[Ochrobactrum] quorumnocens]
MLRYRPKNAYPAFLIVQHRVLHIRRPIYRPSVFGTAKGGVGA